MLWVNELHSLLLNAKSSLLNYNVNDNLYKGVKSN